MKKIKECISEFLYDFIDDEMYLKTKAIIIVVLFLIVSRQEYLWS